MKKGLTPSHLDGLGSVFFFTINDFADGDLNEKLKPPADGRKVARKVFGYGTNF